MMGGAALSPAYQRAVLTAHIHAIGGARGSRHDQLALAVQPTVQWSLIVLPRTHQSPSLYPSNTWVSWQITQYHLDLHRLVQFPLQKCLPSVPQLFFGPVCAWDHQGL